MQTVMQLIKNDGNQYMEFETLFQKEIISSMVAFANAKGGKILIGVSEEVKISTSTYRKVSKLQNSFFY